MVLRSATKPATLRGLPHHFPLRVVQEPHHCCILWAEMDLGNKDGSPLKICYRIFRLLSTACGLYFMKGGFVRISGSLNPRTGVLRDCIHRGPCPLFLQLYSRRLCYPLQWKCDIEMAEPCSSIFVPFLLC